MSGDSGLQEQPVIFYSEEMTVSKMILLSQKGVTFKKYEYLLDVLEEKDELKKEVIALRRKIKYYKAVIEEKEERYC